MEPRNLTRKLSVKAAVSMASSRAPITSVASDWSNGFILLYKNNQSNLTNL